MRLTRGLGGAIPGIESIPVCTARGSVPFPSPEGITLKTAFADGDDGDKAMWRMLPKRGAGVEENEAGVAPVPRKIFRGVKRPG